MEKWKVEKMYGINGVSPWWLVRISEMVTVKSVRASALTEEQAHLIAAAPDLLRALKEMKRYSSVIPVKFQQDIWDIINPALKQAEREV